MAWPTISSKFRISPKHDSGRVLSEVFMQVPPQSSYPDYYQVISKPISFQLVRSRLKNRNYQTIEKFKDDVNLIFDNAQFYNEEGSIIWQDAKEMKDYFNKLLLPRVLEKVVILVIRINLNYDMLRICRVKLVVILILSLILLPHQ
jgi:hypothetical protein